VWAGVVAVEVDLGVGGWEGVLWLRCSWGEGEEEEEEEEEEGGAWWWKLGSDICCQLMGRRSWGPICWGAKAAGGMMIWG